MFASGKTSNKWLKVGARQIQAHLFACRAPTLMLWPPSSHGQQRHLPYSHVKGRSVYIHTEHTDKHICTYGHTLIKIPSLRMSLPHRYVQICTHPDNTPIWMECPWEFYIPLQSTGHPDPQQPCHVCSSKTSPMQSGKLALKPGSFLTNAEAHLVSCNPHFHGPCCYQLGLQLPA